MPGYFKFVIDKNHLKFDNISIIKTNDDLLDFVVYEELKWALPDKNISIIDSFNLSNNISNINVLPCYNNFINQNKKLIKKLLFKRIPQNFNLMIFNVNDRKVYIKSGTTIKSFFIYWLILTYLTYLVTNFKIFRNTIKGVLKIIYFK